MTLIGGATQYIAQLGQRQDRYITIGQINGIAVTVIIMVVYTERERAIRLISARKATPQEGRMYYDYTQRN